MIKGDLPTKLLHPHPVPDTSDTHQPGSDGGGDAEAVMMVNGKPPRSRKISVQDKEKLGLFNVRAFTFLLLWYFFSACTLFLNKYILATLKSDPTLLGKSKMPTLTNCNSKFFLE